MNFLLNLLSFPYNGDSILLDVSHSNVLNTSFLFFNCNLSRTSSGVIIPFSSAFLKADPFSILGCDNVLRTISFHAGIPTPDDTPAPMNIISFFSLIASMSW